MAFSHGKNAIFKLHDGSSSLVDLSSYLNNIDMAANADTHETTTFGKDDKTYIPGLRDGTFSLAGNFDPTADALLFGARGTIRAFEYYPDGDSAGKVKYSGDVIVTEYSGSSPVGDLNTVSVSLQVTGGITRATV